MTSMIRTFVVLLALALLAAMMLWQYRAQYTVLEKHQQARQDAAHEQASQVQQQCDQAAAARFQALGLAEGAGAAHTGHFNPVSGQCHVLIESSEQQLGTTWKHITVYDADGKVLASYGWHSEEGRQAADIPPYSCDVTLPSGDQRSCVSEADFRQLVGAYMQ